VIDNVGGRKNSPSPSGCDWKSATYVHGWTVCRRARRRAPVCVARRLFRI